MAGLPLQFLFPKVLFSHTNLFPAKGSAGLTGLDQSLLFATQTFRPGREFDAGIRPANNSTILQHAEFGSMHRTVPCFQAPIGCGRPIQT
jgi:hypothetical protein